jgi:DNA-directed RNA polymerase subunit RPC12/RpoP
MNARSLIDSLIESGPMVDISAGHQRPTIQNKCKNCHRTFGDFASLKQAKENPLCPRCKLRDFEKQRKAIEKVDDPEPKEKKVVKLK